MEIKVIYSNNSELIEGPLLLRPTIFKDERGFFIESWNQDHFNRSLKENINFIQDNHSLSSKGVIRGMHFQASPYQQSKLVRCISGSIFDVIVDIRKDSRTFGHWYGVELNPINQYQLWIPKGFAHGFMSLIKDSEVFYKVDIYRNINYERSLIWNDKSVGINWPTLNTPYCISEKDQLAPLFSDLNENDLLGIY